MYGLTNSDLAILCSLFQKHPTIDEAVLFGSRAKGNFHAGSDVDIALKGQDLKEVILHISTYLNQESLLPYSFDIIDYNSIDNKALTEHVDRVGKVIYSRNDS